MIRKLTVYDGDTQYVRSALAGVGGFRIAYAEDESVPVDSDCVLLVQDLAGEKLVIALKGSLFKLGHIDAVFADERADEESGQPGGEECSGNFGDNGRCQRL